MVKELVIKSTLSGSEIALLEDKKLVELHQEKNNTRFSVGDIYLGRVRKVMPGLNAAFVDVGYHRDAFLHYTDLGPQLKSMLKVMNKALPGKLNDPLLNDFKFEQDIDKNGKITQVLKPKQPILVQILKEPISTKGPRLTGEITIAGRHLVLSPFTSGVGVSKKIPAEERKRLRVLIDSLKPKNFGIVVRTAATGKGSAVLHEEISSLVRKWEKLVANLNGLRPVAKVHSEIDKTSALVRDLLTDDFHKIVTNDASIATEMEEYVQKIAPEKKNIVSVYKGRNPIYDHFDITKQIKSSFGKTVTIANGAYMVIEHTEAMHVIDVNSGNKISQSGDQENNALKINREIASEIARQLRLRDLGGIIIVDFIDMKNAENKRALLKHMKDEMRPDRATHTILPLSKFNLMQITRQRVRPEINITTAETCPSCNGTGKVESTLLLIDEIERNLKHLQERNRKATIMVHPFIQAYLQKGFYKHQRKWWWEYKKWVPIASNDNLALTQYRFLDKEGEEIKLN